MKTEKPIKVLFLDIGGVLLTNGWGHESRTLAAKTFNIDSDEMESRHRITFDTFEIGKISINDYLDRTVFYENRDFNHDQFKEFMFSRSKQLPQMMDLIKAIKTKYGLKVIAVSNECREINEYRIKKFQLDQLFDFFVSSCYVHLRKPDKDIYLTAIDITQVPVEQILYIDDRLMFIEVAQTLGIKGLHHVNYADTLASLGSHGLYLN